MSDMHTIAEHEEVRRLLSIAKKHLDYIKNSRTKEITIPGLKHNHAIVASIFSAAAVETGVNSFLSEPLLLIPDPDSRKYCGALLKRTLRISIRNKLEMVYEISKKVKRNEKMLKEVNSLLNYRNSILHSVPEYSEVHKTQIDWEKKVVTIGDETEPSLRSQGESTEDVRKAFRHYDTARRYLVSLIVE